MKLSTRGRYGLRFMVELASRTDLTKPVFLREASGAQDISEKYLSKLSISLKAAGLIVATRGASGGYRLARKPEDITVLEILNALEGSLRPVDCVDCGFLCKREKICCTKTLWQDLSSVIENFLRSRTLAALVNAAKAGGQKYNDTAGSDSFDSIQ